MAKIYYDQDADRGALAGQTIAVVGYGSQGHAQAQNLRDRGFKVIIGIRPGRTAEQAKADGFEVYDVAEATRRADIVHILLPDETQRQVFLQEIEPNLRPGMAIGFSHGFNIHFGYVSAPEQVDVAMVAPKAPGHLVRRQYEAGQGAPVLVAVEHDATGKAWDLVRSCAKAIGGTKAGARVTTFKEETESDLFGEQAVLCGGVSALVSAGFETLVGAGYQPEVAYFECLHELKLIVDLMQEGGLAWMRYSVSDTAEYGDLTRGPRVIAEPSKQAMAQILADIQSGGFARAGVAADATGAAGEGAGGATSAVLTDAGTLSEFARRTLTCQISVSDNRPLKPVMPVSRMPFSTFQ